MVMSVDCRFGYTVYTSSQVRFLLCLGDVLVSLCDEGRLKAWDLKRRRMARPAQTKNGEWDSDGEDEETGAMCDAALEGDFLPTALAHPPTYLNKVVIGSEGGALQLWNVRTGRCAACMIGVLDAPHRRFGVSSRLQIDDHCVTCY